MGIKPHLGRKLSCNPEQCRRAKAPAVFGEVFMNGGIILLIHFHCTGFGNINANARTHS